MDDINLDFLTTPPRHEHQLERLPTPIVSNRIDIAFGNKKSRKKMLEVAQKIGKVDKLVKEIEALKLDNNELKKQLKDFQKAAQQVQHLYNEEKQQNEQIKTDFNHLKQLYDKTDIELTSKTMQYVQMEARLAEYEGRPVDYDSLVIKFIRIMKKLEGDDCLKYCQDRGLVEELTQYCINMKLKLPIVKSPQKLKSRSVKSKTHDASVQCSNMEIYRVPICKVEMKERYTQTQLVADDSVGNFEKHTPTRTDLKEQYTQCQVSRRDQASQYISTMITRQTNTEKVMQRNVSTMFPEPKPTPPINDILNVFCKWADIRSITPLEESPSSKQTKKTSKSLSSTGTCTMLCNIRRKIDYLPLTTSNIKQELTTPSPSPIPTSNTTSAAALNRTRLNNNITQTSASIPSNVNNQNNLPNAILSFLNATSNSALGQLSTTAFNELWQIFGTMLLSLLQTSNAGIANINHNSINQQQFLDWLLELYIGSQLSSTNTSTPSMSQEVNSTQTSPLRFNNTSVLSASNIIRPEAVKSVNNGLLPSRENNFDEQSNLLRDNHNYVPNTSTSPSPSYTSAGIVENFSHDSNSIMYREIQQIQTSANTVETRTDTYESNVNQLSTNEIFTIKSQKHKNKNKHKIEQQIQELFPEVKLNKNKRKALKRLLNDTKKKKKSKKNKPDNIIINEETDGDQDIETAVDFLKVFAQEQGNFENNDINFKESETKEKEIITQSYLVNNIEKPISYEDQHYLQPLTNSSNNDFTFIKPHNLQQTTKSNKDPSCITFIKPAQKLKKSKLPTRVENKYQMLFGDSDSEIDEEEIPRLNANPVINAIEIVASDIKNVDGNSEAKTSEQNIKGEQQNAVDQPSCYNFSISNTFTNVDQTCPQMISDILIDDTSQEEFSIPQIATPLLENLEKISMFRKPENTSQLSNSNDLFFKKIMQENQTRVNNLTEKQEEIQLIDTEINPTQAYVNVSKYVEKDLELSSDDEIIKEDNHMKSELLSSNNQIYAVENEIKESQNNLHSLNSLPNIQNTNRDHKQEAKTVKINDLCTNYNNLDVCYNIRSLAVINNNTTKIEIEPKENHRLNLEYNSNNIKQTESTETVEQAKSESRSVYETEASDFEKDFELSSDNESELAEVENQFNNGNKITDNGKGKSNNHNNSLSAIKESKNYHNMKDSLEDLKEEGIRGFEPNHKSLVTQQNNFSSDSLIERQENHFFKQLSSDNLRDSDTLTLISLTESEKSLNSTKGSQHIEQDFKGLDKQQCRENKKWEKYNTPKMEQKLKAYEKLQNGAFRESEECVSPEAKHLPKIVNNIQNQENNIKSTHCPGSLRPLPDFNNTFIQKRNPSNAETISKLTNEQNLQNTDQLKICENSSNDDDITESATNLCWSVITVTDTTENSYRHGSSTEDKEISIVEIPSDVTVPDNKRQPESPIENDLIIDEDSNDVLNEENELELESSSHEYLNSQENNVEVFVGEDHNYYQTSQKEFKSKHLNHLKLDGEENKDETLNTTNISSILDSSLYNEVLTDSIKPIVNDLLKYDDILATPSLDGKAKRGRKRKSECLPDELVQTCKRSQRLRAKQIVLEQSINASVTPIEIGKYTRKLKMSPTVEKIKMKNLNQMKPKDEETNNEEIKANKEFKNNLPLIQMGFFKERVVEEDSNKEITKSSFNNEIKIRTLNHTNNHGNLKTNTNCELKNNPPSIQMDFLPQDVAEKNVGEEILLNEMNETCTKKPSGTDCIQNKIEVDYANIPMESNEDTCIENLTQTIASNQSGTPEKNILNTAFCKYSESPKSPPPVQNSDENLNKTYIIIPSEREPEHIPQQRRDDDTLFDTLINNYATQQQKNIHPQRTKAFKNDQIILQNLEKELQLYCYNEMELDPDHTAVKLINKLLQITDNYELIHKALIKIAQNATPLKVPESELPSIIQEMPPRHLSSCLQRLFVVLKHFLHKNLNFCKELILKIESLLFDTQQAEKLSLEATLSLTQFYLLTCKQKETLDISKHPARIFISKCLYYYNKKAKLMVHEVLLWYPTVLPHREDTSYDRSDALITVIQELLMNTKYDMTNQELRDKTLLSKLRYEYHFEPFKPSLAEVIANLVEKLDNSNFYNLSLAFGLLCKRLEPKKVQELFLQTHLLPLASQYYNKALNTLEYDKRISVLLEIISIIVKPFPLCTNVEVYLNEFSRFLNGFDRPVIQEAALCSILRLQRFGCVNCYNLFRHFKPNYTLNPLTQAMLKTFLYRKSLKFWKTIKSQNPKN